MLLVSTAKAQPYMDLVQLSYQNGNGGETGNFEYFRAQANLPIILKDSSLILVNPTWEERWIKVNEFDNSYHVRSVVSWFAYSGTINKKWSVLGALIPRFNGQAAMQFKNGFQAGAAILFSYRAHPGLTWKLGTYYNSEFFGPFIIPLFGLDWKISPRQRLFGVAPGYLTYENRLNGKLYWGGSIRTFTNSYRIDSSMPGQQDHVRIDDNQVGAYIDLYVAKRLVVNAEAGYSVLRRMRTGDGTSAEAKSMLKDHSPYARVSLQYRVRFDQ